jgi:hypothetical protein
LRDVDRTKIISVPFIYAGIFLVLFLEKFLEVTAVIQGTLRSLAAPAAVNSE